MDRVILGSRAIAARNKLANTMRHRKDDAAAVLEARQELAVAKISDFIEKAVAESPEPLTEEQVERIIALLEQA
jgi:hypothetical protein